ncbi:hypothetical protein CLOM_g17932 [Closterium sp. NIES-68]|nr:hypothetical protein CLOM_g17932 [Closterium sp. NIES-68]GJP61066.1 hypothetical protein CLOP_g18274 [Closterium sp. NIES-67]
MDDSRVLGFADELAMSDSGSSSAFSGEHLDSRFNLDSRFGNDVGGYSSDGECTTTGTPGRLERRDGPCSHSLNSHLLNSHLSSSPLHCGSPHPTSPPQQRRRHTQRGYTRLAQLRCECRHRRYCSSPSQLSRSSHHEQPREEQREPREEQQEPLPWQQQRQSEGGAKREGGGHQPQPQQAYLGARGSLGDGCVQQRQNEGCAGREGEEDCSQPCLEQQPQQQQQQQPQPLPVSRAQGLLNDVSGSDSESVRREERSTAHKESVPLAQSSQREGGDSAELSSSSTLLSPNLSSPSFPPASSLPPTTSIPPPSPPRFSPPFLAPPSPSLFPPRQQPLASHSCPQSPVRSAYPTHTRSTLASCSASPAAPSATQGDYRCEFHQKELQPPLLHELQPFWSLPCVRAAVALQPTRSKGHVTMCEARAVSPGNLHHCYHQNCQRHLRNKDVEAVRTISPVSMRCMRSNGRFVLVQSPHRGLCQPLHLMSTGATGAFGASGLSSNQSSRC